MSAVTSFYNNVYSFPVAGAPWAVEFPILDNTGALVSGAAGLDSERSKDGDTFADCTNEATEIGSSGMYYLQLTATETAVAAILSVVVKTSTTDAKATPMVFYPKQTVLMENGTCVSGSGNTATLAASAVAIDQFYRGMLLQVNIDGTLEYRLITSYNGSTKVAQVTPPWVTADPDNTDTYFIYAVADELSVRLANAVAWNTVAVPTPATAGIPDVNAKNWNNLTTVELPLVPTTAGRKLDVSTGGEAGIDWANIGSPTTTQNLTNTTVKTADQGWRQP